MEPTVECPKCSHKIKLTESLAAPLLKVTKEEYEKKILEQENLISQREKKISEKEKQIENRIATKVAEERRSITQEEKQKAKLAVEEDMNSIVRQLTELQTLLEAKNVKLAEAQKVQAEMLRKERALEDAQRELDLTIENRVKEGLEEIRVKARQDAEESLKLKVVEKEEQISSMQKQIEELKRKAEQGSQQLQGEAQELELEKELGIKFPSDSIEPVAKGEFGGDVTQKVVSASGISSGCILWETKRTKNWSDGWLAKLRGDQRTAKADIALLMSHALPKGIETFGFIDGVWVSGPRYAIPLVVALRQSLIELYAARQSKEGQLTKMEMVYDYLTGSKFRHRVEAIVEKISDMQMDLDKERKMMMRSWAKREAQIHSVVDSTVGMYGDLQGIAGRALQEIDGLDMPMLETDQK